ncbi:MAG: hypothetical protein AAF447_01455 [Myxococcota bacterium]
MSRAALAMLALLSALPGCASDELDGSLGSVYPLGFRSVRARLYSSSLSIEYVRGDGSVPVRVTMDRAAVLATPEAIDLRESGDITGRLATDQEIPRFTTGDAAVTPLEVNGAGEVTSARVRGSFGATFEVGPEEVLALDGSFDAPLEIVPDPGPAPPGR